MSNKNLPTSFLTDFISRGWTEVGDLKNAIQSIDQDFKKSDEVKEILQDLSDAYLVCIGRLEKYMDAEDYIETTAVEAAEAQNDESGDETDKSKEVAAKAEIVDDMANNEPKTALPAVTADVKAALVDDDEVEDEVNTEANVEKDFEPFEFEADFDDIDIDAESGMTDQDIEDLRKMFSI